MQVRKLVYAVMSGSLATGAVLLTAGTASAAACGSPIAAGSNCTLTGTVNLTGGALNLTASSSLTWTGTLNGLNQSVTDVLPGDQQYTVNDATGTGAGWHVTAAATQFTNGSNTFLNTGTFTTNGSITSITSTSAPAATCTGSCTLPTNTTTYPVAITTAATAPTPVTIYDTAVSTGLGQVVIGGSTSANPVGWWVNVPASASAGAYTSTITMAIISGP